MKHLSRDEMKKVMGGDIVQDQIGDDDGGTCVNDADCTGTDLKCNGTTVHVSSGRCYATGGNEKKCHYSTGC